MNRRFAAGCFALALAGLPLALSGEPPLRLFAAELRRDRADARRATAGQAATATSVEPNVDAVFARWSSSTPGCAVGVATDGTPVLARGYGMADLEHDVPNTADTIFESGSVAKQFTAMAVMLLYLSLPLEGRHPLTLAHPEPLELADRDVLVADAGDDLARAARAGGAEHGDVEDDEGQDHQEQHVLQPIPVAPHETERHVLESPSCALDARAETWILAAARVPGQPHCLSGGPFPHSPPPDRTVAPSVPPAPNVTV